MKKLSHQFDKPKRSVASPEALEALRNNNAVRWYVLSLPDCHRGGVRGLQREQDRRIQAGEPSFGLSGNFWLVSFKISYLCLPLFHETRTTPSCHPSGCAYRQL